MEIETALEMTLRDISRLLCEKQKILDKPNVTMEMKGTNLWTGRRICLTVNLKEIEE